MSSRSKAGTSHAFTPNCADPPFCACCGWHSWHPNHDAVLKMVPKVAERRSEVTAEQVAP